MSCKSAQAIHSPDIWLGHKLDQRPQVLLTYFQKTTHLDIDNWLALFANS